MGYHTSLHQPTECNRETQWTKLRFGYLKNSTNKIQEDVRGSKIFIKWYKSK